MVKRLLLAALLLVNVSADELLYGKIQELIGEKAFREHMGLIKIVFSPTGSYYNGERLDVVRVMETLRENNLITLDFGRPRQMEMTFSTVGSPLFFVKLMEETLRSIGYIRYNTVESRRDGEKFSWKISLSSEHATDPSMLGGELLKRGCRITDITRENSERWVYEVNMLEAHLNLEPMVNGSQLRVNRLLDVYWLNVAHVQHITFNSLGANNWYPYIAFFDADMNLLQVYKRDRKSWQVMLRAPKEAVYAKVADLYSMKNIKDGFHILGRGRK